MVEFLRIICAPGTFFSYSVPKTDVAFTILVVVQGASTQVAKMTGLNLRWSVGKVYDSRA